ncbi:MAG: hypothetical protein OXC40_07810, partial [Proteobacteria bacterium]|nr:hypothetical protein [Pseudomonadota bacterium]
SFEQTLKNQFSFRGVFTFKGELTNNKNASESDQQAGGEAAELSLGEQSERDIEEKQKKTTQLLTNSQISRDIKKLFPAAQLTITPLSTDESVD